MHSCHDCVRGACMPEHAEICKVCFDREAQLPTRWEPKPPRRLARESDPMPTPHVISCGV